MKRLILFFAALHIVFSKCPDGFEMVNGECRGKYVTLTNVPWNQATDTITAKCKEIGGLPVIIHDAEHESYWERFTNNDDHFPIGMMCNKTSKEWQWVDGSALDYKPPKYYSELDKDCMAYDDCTWIIFNHDQRWIPGNCDNTGQYTFDVFCTTPLLPVPVPSADGCDSFSDDTADGVCYQVGATVENWQDAQMACKKLGANLASIHNQQENSFVRRLAVSKGATNGVYLGATISGKGNDYSWIDGTSWDYTNFHSGFPMPGIGDCVALDTTTSSGQWINTDCSTKLPVACIREKRTIEEPICSDGPLEEDVIFTSPGFPYNASIPCDFFLTVDAGKKVEAEIVFLDANPGSDFLILYDGFIGGPVIANLTGIVGNVTYTSSSNLMRVDWRPNGGVNSWGMAMTFHGV